MGKWTDIYCIRNLALKLKWELIAELFLLIVLADNKDKVKEKGQEQEAKCPHTGALWSLRRHPLCFFIPYSRQPNIPSCSPSHSPSPSSSPSNHTGPGLCFSEMAMQAHRQSRDSQGHHRLAFNLAKRDCR